MREAPWVIIAESLLVLHEPQVATNGVLRLEEAHAFWKTNKHQAVGDKRSRTPPAATQTMTACLVA